MDFGAVSRGTLPAKCREADPRIEACCEGVKKRQERLPSTSRGGGASAAGRLLVLRVRGALGGPGPRALRARCVPRPARKARRAGATRLRAAFSPPPPAPRGFGRQGAGAGGTGVRGLAAGGNGADRCPRPLTGRSLSCVWLDACSCWRQGRQGQAEKVTGLRGACGGAALWKVDWVRSSRCGLTVAEMGRAGRLPS